MHLAPERHVLVKQEEDGGLGGTLRLAEQALDGEDTLSCRLIAEPLKVGVMATAKFSQ